MILPLLRKNTPTPDFLPTASLTAACALLLLSAAALAAQQIDIFQPDRFDLTNAVATTVTHRGQQALRLTQAHQVPENADTDFSAAVIRGLSMLNGEVEMEVAGEPGPSANVTARGFVGVAFRMQDTRHLEVFYLRPTNGRADDQVRRNHSVQYEGLPDFPWFRLRKEFPEKYETYVDLEPAAWTRIRITVEGSRARLYVHGSAQPTLIVNDLKLTPVSGSIGLWIGPGTIGHFRAVRATVR